MARDWEPKEGIDFEWTTIPGTNARGRHFFSLAEKNARNRGEAPPERVEIPSRKRRPITTRRPIDEPPTATSIPGPSPIKEESLHELNNPIVEGAREAIDRSEYEERLARTRGTMKDLRRERREARRQGTRTPIAQAILNTIRGEGPTNPYDVKQERKQRRTREAEIARDSSFDPAKYKRGEFSQGGLVSRRDRKSNK